MVVVHSVGRDMKKELQKKSFNEITFEEFKRIFNHSFWKAFSRLPRPLLDVKNCIGSEKEVRAKTSQVREKLLKSVYDSIKERTYYPSTPEYYLIKNKGKGVARVIPVFSAKDYCVYYYCIYRLESIIAIDRVPNTYGGWSLGGRMRAIEEKELDNKKTEIDGLEAEVALWMELSTPSYSFNPNAWSKIYGDFNAKLFAASKTNIHSYYAEFDISNFYDCIRLDILERKIRQRFDKEYEDDVTLLFHFLHYWNRSLNHYNAQSVGLPQDAMNDCSRILANYYLQEYDAYISDICRKMKAGYFRYSDDQFFFADSQQDLEYLIYKATKKLVSIGLSLNQKKVRIGTASSLIKYRSFEMYDKVSSIDEERDISKIEEFIDEYFRLLDSKEILDIKNNGINLLNRALSFTRILRKLPNAKRIRLLSCYLDKKYLVDSRADQLERIYSLLITHGERAGFCGLLDELSKETFHNYFHYQVLVFYKKNHLNFDHILARIDELEKG